ncbi:signal transduction histidine kinase [Kibdelosporangium banguiense]|uniref:histidine kinase n=1 Tax=Kibdelosporangium banguiense TaxID=1365924 RepID=A0ABS4TJ43_9PSEU|nr:sensor histidine kinase [Kibdelosporangium banguiense]MBP2324035.1 signal transduction histidine kinase [Kibdelosporangium banguiense]
MDEIDVRPLYNGLSKRQWYSLDVMGAVAYTLLFGSPLATTELFQQPDWLVWLFAAGMGLPLMARRRWPWQVFLWVFAVATVALCFGMLGDPFVAPSFALYLVALTARRPNWEPTLWIALVSVTMLLLVAMALPIRETWSTLGLISVGLAGLGGSWTLGRTVRDRRANIIRQADRAVTEERLRIARELHDVIAHSMGLMVVKADVTNHLVDVQPAQAREALRVIEKTGRDALVEMRHMLGVLRAGGSTKVELTPAPGPNGLPELAERAGLAGVRVELETSGVERLPEGIGLSVYRIVQEALTNVVRHAAPARCRIVVEADGKEVRIDVTDDGPGSRTLPRRAGHGLIGIRERVMMYGGTFAAGPQPQRGFRLQARLPYGEAQ